MNVPEGNLHEVCFEALEQDPLGELEKAYAGLNLPGFDAVKATIEPEIPKLKRYEKNQYSTLDAVTKRRIFSRLRPAIERYGYSAEGADSVLHQKLESEVA